MVKLHWLLVLSDCSLDDVRPGPGRYWFSTVVLTPVQAFVAVQHEHVTGIDSELVTVVVRERNVLITVSESGQESGHGFGPVPVSTLQAGAEAAARTVLAKARTEPTA